MFGRSLALPSCKMTLQDWVGMTPNLSIRDQLIDGFDKFTYLGSCTFAGGSLAEESPSRIQKARQISNLHQLWRRSDIELSTKGGIYPVAVRSVLLRGLATWEVKAEDIGGYRCSSTVVSEVLVILRWNKRLTTEVRGGVFRPMDMSAIRQKNIHKLQWLVYILGISDGRLLGQVLFAESPSDWKRPSSGQHITWQKNMKSLTEVLSRVDNVRLAGRNFETLCKPRPPNNPCQKPDGPLATNMTLSHCLSVWAKIIGISSGKPCMLFSKWSQIPWCK